MSSKKGVNLKGSAWGILHAAVVLIRREAPLSSEHWTKFEFKKLFPDYKKEGLINPYANKVLVQPSPVNPDEILRKETVEWLQDIAESDDPCAFVEYEGKCEFCEAVRKWSDEGERKLEAWKRWTAGKDEVE